MCSSLWLYVLVVMLPRTAARAAQPPIYVINLARSAERWEKMSEQLRAHGLQAAHAHIDGQDARTHALVLVLDRAHTNSHATHVHARTRAHGPQAQRLEGVDGRVMSEEQLHMASAHAPAPPLPSPKAYTYSRAR